MSGYILDAVQTIGSVLGADSVNVGPVTLYDLERPSSFPVVTDQAVAVQKMPGGGRIVNALGPDLPDKMWSGTIISQDQIERVQLLDNICKSGKEITVSWNSFSYQGIVSHFQADVKSVGPIPYHITVTLISDNSAPSGQSLISLAAQVIGDVETGNYLGALGAVSQGVVAAPVTAAGTAVAAPGATTVGSSLYNSAVSAVNNAATAINKQAAVVNAALGTYGTSLAQVGQAAATAAPILEMTGAIGGAVSAAGDAAQLASMGGYINRAGVNLSNASA